MAFVVAGRQAHRLPVLPRRQLGDIRYERGREPADQRVAQPGRGLGAGMVAGAEKVMLPQHITLTGFMGSGKSSVAQAVAAKLGWEAIDGDDVVEQREGAHAGALIDQHGEQAFRPMEAATYEALAGKERVVVASGGGAPTYADTRREMAKAGLV